MVEPQEPQPAALTEQPLVKHPLQHAWTLWYYEPDRNKSWEDNQNQVSTFTNVEDFWSLFTHIKQPSEVKIGSDYSLFKESIRPMWEDKANKNGGRWMITLSRNQRPELDRYWIDTVSCVTCKIMKCELIRISLLGSLLDWGGLRQLRWHMRCSCEHSCQGRQDR